MNTRIIVKEFPFLKSFIKEHSIEEAGIKRLGKNILDLPLVNNGHSWAGSKGVIAFLIFKDGESEECRSGGWYSDNGRTTRDDPPIPLWESFLASNGRLSFRKFLRLEAIALNDWDRYDNPSPEYDNWEIYVRPRREDIRKKLEREFQGEIDRLREIVG
ncbi:hypothetical protein ES703_32421 [subsurface metagenome]